MPIVHYRLLCSLLIFSLIQLSCTPYVTRVEFEDFIKRQNRVDIDQNKFIDDTAAKLSCSDRNVQDFIRRCREGDSKCDTLQITSVVSKMYSYQHQIFRLPYIAGHELAMVSDDQMLDLVTMFSHHNVWPSTKLLIVAIASHQLKTPSPPATKLAGGKKSGMRPVDVRPEPDIPKDKVALLTRNLRNGFAKSPYKLSEKVITGMEPQIPSCDTRSDELIRHFRDHPDSQLRPEEQKIRGPYIDFLVFMVDCQ